MRPLLRSARCTWQGGRSSQDVAGSLSVCARRRSVLQRLADACAQGGDRGRRRSRVGVGSQRMSRASLPQRPFRLAAVRLPRTHRSDGGRDGQGGGRSHQSRAQCGGGREGTDEQWSTGVAKFATDFC